MSVAVVVGTRPEIIKMSPIIRELDKRKLRYKIIHSGQHYDHDVSDIFFKELDLPEPDRYLGIGSGTQGEQTGNALIKLEKAFKDFEIENVLVQGDTNTVLAATLAGIKLGLDVGHVEAGLRSYDYRMPEEYNRRLADHASSLLFAPTEDSAEILRGENVWGDIYVTGNSVIDACIQNMGIAEKKAEFDFDMPEEYILVTAHRAENVDDKKVQEEFIKVFKEISKPMVYPIHPRSVKMFKKHGLYDELEGIKGLNLVKPQGYLEFLLLMKNSKFILTDSGGIQEEATAPNIRKKVFVLRESTERPEAVEEEYAEIVGTGSEKILKSIRNFEINKWNPGKSPYGDGTTARKIVDVIERS